MKRFIQTLITASIILGVACSAHALPFGFGYANVNVNSFDYSNNVSVHADHSSLYSAAYASALDPDEVSSDRIYHLGYQMPFENWAIAYTSNASSGAGTKYGYSSSRAAVWAGQEPGLYSAAMAATVAGACHYYVLESSDITISIDYYLGSVAKDNESGSTAAGSGALLGIFQNGGIIKYRSQWLDVKGGSSSNHDSLQGTLEITLTGMEAGSAFDAFVSTVAHAATSAGADPVPEPATMILLGSGLIGLASFGRKKWLR